MKISDFIRNIGIPEFNSIIGKGGSKILFLILILFISLIAMGIANGSLNHLKKVMNSPFIKFIDVPHNFRGPAPGKKEFNIQLAREYARKNPDQIKDTNDVFETYTYNLQFFKNDIENIIAKFGFVLSTDNKFYRTLEEKNYFLTNNSFHDDQWGVIITKKFMKDLNIDLSTPYINIREGSTKNGLKKTFLRIPICGVVEDLRDNKSFIKTKKLYQ